MLHLIAVVAAAPPFAAVDQAVCSAVSMPVVHCTVASFEPPIAIDVNNDGRSEWIYVVRAGRPACQVRHACFAVVERRGRRWRAVLSGMSGMAGEIAVRGRGSRGRHRELVTGAANSASETRVTTYRWRRGCYRAVGSRSCRYPCAAVANAVAIQ